MFSAVRAGSPVQSVSSTGVVDPGRLRGRGEAGDGVVGVADRVQAAEQIGVLVGVPRGARGTVQADVAGQPRLQPARERVPHHGAGNGAWSSSTCAIPADRCGAGARVPAYERALLRVVGVHAEQHRQPAGGGRCDAGRRDVAARAGGHSAVLRSRSRRGRHRGRRGSGNASRRRRPTGTVERGQQQVECLGVAVVVVPGGAGAEHLQIHPRPAAASPRDGTARRTPGRAAAACSASATGCAVGSTLTAVPHRDPPCRAQQVPRQRDRRRAQAVGHEVVLGSPDVVEARRPRRRRRRPPPRATCPRGRAPAIPRPGGTSRPASPYPRPVPEPSTLYLVKRLELAIRAGARRRAAPARADRARSTRPSPRSRSATPPGATDWTSAQLARRSFVTPQTMHEQVTAARTGAGTSCRASRTRRTGGCCGSGSPEHGRDRMRDCADVVDELEGLVEGALGPEQRDGFRDALTRALAAVEPVARGLSYGVAARRARLASFIRRPDNGGARDRSTHGRRGFTTVRVEVDDEPGSAGCSSTGPTSATP